MDEIPILSQSPRARVRQIAAHQLRAHRTLVKAADEENRKNLEDDLRELSAKQSLAKSLAAVIALLVRMKKKAALEKPGRA
ncbi:MAG: hypothetical protein IPG64_08460 [Haliea sp.]|nr:hypothetical protein [Haliea sp.]